MSDRLQAGDRSEGQFDRRQLLASGGALLMMHVTGCSPTPSADAGDKQANSAAEPAVRLVFVGDVMLDDGPGKAIEAGVDPFVHFGPLLKNADIAVGNLECVIATVGERVEKPYNFRAHPRCIPLLVEYFDGVSAANNHSGDFGPDALMEQMQLLETARLPCFGAGRDLRQAHMPWIVERRGIRFAILGYNEFKPQSFEADVDRPGLAWSYDPQVINDIRDARRLHHADIVIPFMHWGWEYEPENARQKALARAMIDAGADIVIGGHPHVTQGVEYYQGKLIVYSLGNFVFDGFTTPESTTGWALQLDMDKHGLLDWRTYVAHMDQQGVPHLDTESPSPRGNARKQELA